MEFSDCSTNEENVELDSSTNSSVEVLLRTLTGVDGRRVTGESSKRHLRADVDVNESSWSAAIRIRFV